MDRLALIGAVVSPMVAASKGRNALGWCALGFLMPMIAIVAIYCLPKLAPPEGAQG